MCSSFFTSIRLRNVAVIDIHICSGCVVLFRLRLRYEVREKPDWIAPFHCFFARHRGRERDGGKNRMDRNYRDVNES